MADDLEGMKAKTHCLCELAITCVQTLQQARVFCAQLYKRTVLAQQAVQESSVEQPGEVLNRDEYGINQRKIGKYNNSLITNIESTLLTP